MTRKMPTTGSKAQVWHGTAKHTSGGLTRKDLMRHKGKIGEDIDHPARLPRSHRTDQGRRGPVLRQGHYENLVTGRSTATPSMMMSTFSL